ncbi:hypothetical protein PanWU01x14_256140, partial [Parasponia andersonii]
PGGRRARQERPGQGKNLEPALQRDDPTRGGRLPESDVGDNAAATENRNPAMPPLSESSYALNDVVSAPDLQHMASKRVGALLGDNHRRLRLVLGPRRPATWPSVAASSSSATAASAWLQAVVAS